jgi:transcriptional regulator with XRE-family HTH domain
MKAGELFITRAERCSIITSRMKELADQKCLSMSRVLQDCGVQSNFYNAIKNRNAIPAADSFIPIADYFGVSVDYLLGRTSSKDPELANILIKTEDIYKKHELSDDGKFVDYLDMQVAAYKKITG